LPTAGLIAIAASARISLLPPLCGHAIPPMFVRIGGKRKQSPRLPALVTLFAITLAALLWPGVSSADDCSGLAACQATDQARLLGPFNALLGSPAGAAVLATNLQTQNAIYLNSTQAQKVASGTVLIVQYTQLTREPENLRDR
jgi:hypothetical protein